MVFFSYVWADGRTYEGQFVNGGRHGFGLFTVPDDYSSTKLRSYSGDWVDDVISGNGFMIYKNGKKTKIIIYILIGFNKKIYSYLEMNKKQKISFYLRYNDYF